jgi:nitroreductase
MELKYVIVVRRAIRSFTPQPVGKTQIEALIDAAIQAPSAMNTQPWMFHVISDQSLLARVSSEAKRHMLKTTALGTAAHHFEAMLSDEAFHIFYHAPTVIVICAVAESPWAQIDCSLAAQNLMLSAYEFGIGSCWIGFAQSWLNTNEGKALLGIATEHVPVAPIAIGYPTGTVPTIPRREPLISWPSGAD